MLRLLADNTTYEKLKSDPTTKLKAELTDWVKKGSRDKILDKKEAKYFIPHAPIIWSFILFQRSTNPKKTPQDGSSLVRLVPYIQG